MTVSSQVNRKDYSGNGSTTNFATEFRFLEDSHLKVILTVDLTGVETVQSITTNYTVTGKGEDSGGTVTMIIAPATGETLTIKRDVPVTQQTEYVENDDFPAESHERALDKLTMIVQEQQEELDRSLKLSEGQISSGLTIPAPDEGKFLQWDMNGNFLNVDIKTLGSISLGNLVQKDSVTGAGEMPSGTTAQRPSNSVGLFRYNTTLGQMEDSNATDWKVRQEVTPEVITEGQNWAGKAYTDPDAIGANPTAKIYPDGSVVGSTDNGNYTKYPNGDAECRSELTTSAGNTGVTLPLAFIDTIYTVTGDTSVNSGNSSLSVKFSSPTSSSFNVSVVTSANTFSAQGINWIAKGRWI